MPGEATKQQLKFRDCHIFSLPSQGSVYTLSRLPTTNPSNSHQRCRLLVASLHRPVFLLEFNHGFKQSLVPYSRELGFTYLPGLAEIVSVTSYCKPGSSSTIMGVSYIKVGENEGGQCLNIYTIKENGAADLNSDGLAFSCSIEIDFIPYHLTHCTTSSNEVAIVLSGSDNRVHIFSEDSVTHFAQERTEYPEMPELSDREFPSVVLWVEFFKFKQQFRLTAVGCECGALFLFKVDLKTNLIISSFNVNHGISITSCHFFATDDESVQLLVTSALLPATIYRNVLSADALKESWTLPDSEKHDVVTCSLVCDIHMDGKPTLLLGTYGQELLAYRSDPESGWILAWQKSFSHPILSLDYSDVTGDGVKELIALTTRGVQVLQHDLEDVAEILTQRLIKVTQ